MLNRFPDRRLVCSECEARTETSWAEITIGLLVAARLVQLGGMQLSELVGALLGVLLGGLVGLLVGVAPPPNWQHATSARTPLMSVQSG